MVYLSLQSRRMMSEIIFCLIDHAMVNKAWLETDLKSYANFLLSFCISDLSPSIGKS